jgi:hypothetical protein
MTDADVDADAAAEGCCWEMRMAVICFSSWMLSPPPLLEEEEGGGADADAV